MQQVNNFSEVHEVLAGFVPPARSMRAKYSLERMLKLMDELGNPQESFKTIHVAGTSGKTSTCYYIAALLGATGKKIGVTVSPHIDEVNERLQINLTPLSEQEFCQELNEFLKILNRLSVKPTYFELLIAFAYWQFAKQKVDYAVIEVGLGGLLDGTNVINRADKVCVITDIGLDHTSVLGNTVEKIAAQKAGIIQSKNQVIMNAQDPEIMTVIKQRQGEKQASLIIVETDEAITQNDMPWFQHRNWQLAYAVYKYVSNRDGLEDLDTNQINKAMKTYIPARMEIVNKNGQTIIMDGAHNPQKVGALVRSLQSKFPNQKMQVVMGLLSDKEVKGVLEQLKPVTKSLYATYFDAEQDMPRSAIQPAEIAEAAKALGIEALEIKEPEKAFKESLKTNDSVLVVGSFFLLNHIRPILKRDNLLV